jgi:hypothetical protein
MPISRMFSSTEDATAAVGDLTEAGYNPADIRLVGAGTTPEALKKAGVAPARAYPYAALINAGKVLVIVAAPFGTAADAIAILEKARGTEPAPAPTSHEGFATDEAAPLSNALGLGVLSQNPTPFSSFWYLPILLSKENTHHKWWGFPLLSKKAAPLSALIGFKALWGHPTPFSSKIGFKTLIGDAAPFSKLIKFKTLIGEATPLSSAAGVRTLSRRASPLSSLLGLTVLIKHRSGPPPR